jgi:hypothetical protein
MCPADGVTPAAVPVSVTTARWPPRTGGPPDAQVSGAFRGRAAPVAPERLVGGHLPERRQAVRRGGGQGLHGQFLPCRPAGGNGHSQLAFIVHMFDSGQMAHDRLGPDRDRLLAAQISGTAIRHARWGGLPDAGAAAGAAELPEVADGRGDLLAEVAGLALGTAEGKGAEYQARGQAIAVLCRAAGADEAFIPRWTQIGHTTVDADRPGTGRAGTYAAVQPAMPRTAAPVSLPDMRDQHASLVTAEAYETDIPRRRAGNIRLAAWRWSGCPHPAPPAGLPLAHGNIANNLSIRIRLLAQKSCPDNRSHLAPGTAPRACSTRSN